jgi:hypothetical protein
MMMMMMMREDSRNDIHGAAENVKGKLSNYRVVSTCFI